jgi:hypothetical protein
MIIYSICHRYGGTQKMVMKYDDVLVTTLEFAGFIIYFKQQLPTTEEVNLFYPYCLKQGDTLWNPSLFSG